jgi:RNA polymerase sigma-70 factor (ECF subfamily)
MVGAFREALASTAALRFDDAALGDLLVSLRDAATAAYPNIEVDEATFCRELARRSGDGASPESLAKLRAAHVHLAIACEHGNELAIRRFQSELLDEVDACARNVRASPVQADEVRSHILALLFVGDGTRPAALRSYSGRGDLRSYLRVIATRELIRVIGVERRELASPAESFLDRLAPASDVEVGYLREAYRADVDAAMRVALQTLPDDARALLRYSLIDGWTVDRIGTLYGVHRATAARRVAAARDQLAAAIRLELSTRLVIPIEEVDSVVRLVQSRIDVSLSRLLS